MHNAEIGAVDSQISVAPLRRTSGAFKVILVILGVAVGVFLATAVYQTVRGHIVHGVGNQYSWGIMVANIVNLIGISHVGIAISAFVRIMRLERYKQLARLAELVTFTALTAAVINIGLDVGRLDRFVPYVVWFGRWHSPFVWSMTVITAYFLASIVYLYLAMRSDLAQCATLVPRRKRFYEFLSLGYSDTEGERKAHTRTIWWLAVLIIPVMVSVHSVYGLIFGLQAGRPGWFNPFMAPYFVLGAVVSGFSAMVLVVAILRKVFRWESVFPPYIFRGLGTFLGFMTLLYIYFMLTELLTGQYGPPAKDWEVFYDILHGTFRWYSWTFFVGGLVIPFFLLFIQWVRKKASIALTVVAASAIFVSMWVMRALIVIPSFYHAHFLYSFEPYRPTWVEWVLVFGCYAVAGFFYLILCKIVPVLELPAKEAASGGTSVLPTWRKALVVITAIAGVGLIVAGISLHEMVPASLIWVVGIVVLITVPLQICLRPVVKSAG
ncbi:MAG: NrfD/PsrC family molybdoenzyme membrane anchor subunit [bacterium]